VKPDQLQKLVRTVGEFPTLPTVVARVIQELNNPFSSAASMTDLISVDQAMTFRILKMANSAYYGFPRAISTVTESIVLLGFSTVRNLMLTTLMYEFNEMMPPRPGRRGRGPAGFNQRQEWKHSVAAAVSAREILLLRHREPIEHLGYLAGLMHDIGKIFFYHYQPEEYARVLQAAPGEAGELCRLEEQIMGAQHGQVGAWIVDRWNLPPEIVEPIAKHHFPDEAQEQRELTAVLHAANQAAHLAQLAPEAQTAWLAEHPDGLGTLELTPDQIAALWRIVSREIQQIEEFMAV
jgi:putative nucleotidyltransferase with HDIG domain